MLLPELLTRPHDLLASCSRHLILHDVPPDEVHDRLIDLLDDEVARMEEQIEAEIAEEDGEAEDAEFDSPWPEGLDPVHPPAYADDLAVSAGSTRRDP